MDEMMNKSMKKLLQGALLSVAMCGVVHAEKADSTKPTVIEADQGTADDVKQTRTLTGNVVLTRGTLRMKAGRALVTEDSQGYQFITFWAAQGALATFRQKRDGPGDLWVEGEAERIEYDNKTEIAKLFTKAKLIRLDGTTPTDQVEGAYISYEGRKELFTVHNQNSGDSTPGGGRVKMVIQPTTATQTPTPAPGR
jgi:lipopolysaccharide export system protein LptA